ncbi:MAG: hypothetical protein IPP15_21650 [Saprospiraceae bacterium]|uniref:Uncharacterized protein n=1 Tax=Candidatus Opimibacter skivensis TaxID=2982028 RepID=A0A9D7T237_9BACT|nr:hypothetical protein [Candidatus Opimibacter skivensis]
MEERSDKSPHILNTSATLLGLCFIVLTSLKLNNKAEATLIDEFTAIAILMFMVSSFLSFLSMRSNRIPSQRYEKFADFIFLSGLFFLFLTTILILFNFIQ